MRSVLERTKALQEKLPFAKKGMKPIKKKWFLSLGIVAVLVIAAFVLLRGKGPRGVQISYLETPVEPRTIISSLSGSGTLLPANTYTVTTLVEGDILTADFEEGDLVEKDTVLYEIDSSDAANNIEKAQIFLNQAQRAYDDTVDGQNIRATTSGTLFRLSVDVGDEVSQGQEIAVIRESSVMKLTVPFPADAARSFYVGQAAEVLLDNSFETLEGTVTAVSGSDIVGTGNMITRNVTVSVKNPGGLGVEQAASVTINGVGCAASGVFEYQSESIVNATVSGTVKAIHVQEGSAVSKNQALITLGGDALDDAIQNAQDNLRSAELSMDSTQNQLDNYTLTSPIQGTIVDKQYKAGDTVEGETYAGVITKVSVLGTTSGGVTSYPVTVRIDETDGLRSGMNVDAEIVLEQAEDVLAVPVEAVNRGKLVLVTADSPSAANASEQDAPEGYAYVTVETGVSDDAYIEILSGLQEGDTVAYTPSSGDSGMMMMPGMMGGGMPAGGEMPGGGMPAGGGMPGGGMGGGPMG